MSGRLHDVSDGCGGVVRVANRALELRGECAHAARRCLHGRWQACLSIGLFAHLFGVLLRSTRCISLVYYRTLLLQETRARNLPALPLPRCTNPCLAAHACSLLPSAQTRHDSDIVAPVYLSSPHSTQPIAHSASKTFPHTSTRRLMSLIIVLGGVFCLRPAAASTFAPDCLTPASALPSARCLCAPLPLSCNPNALVPR